MGDGVRDMGVVPERGEVGGERWGLAFEWHGDDGWVCRGWMDGWFVEIRCGSRWTPAVDGHKRGLRTRESGEVFIIEIDVYIW